VLAVVNGAFSERFADIARACGREVTVLDVPWGRGADADDVARALARGRHAAVTVVHSETSTAALTDVRAVAAAARAHGAACLVDSVTGVGGAELHADAWGLDFVLTGSQKALALPPGLAFGVASEAFARGATDAPARGRYFDLAEFEAYAAKRQTPNTPALPLLYALDAQLAAMATCEPIAARWARHAAMADATYAWVDAHAERFGIGVLAPAGRALADGHGDHAPRGARRRRGGARGGRARLRHRRRATGSSGGRRCASATWATTRRPRSPAASTRSASAMGALLG
jgi:aspartate aminotransferase-like enzyme